MIPRMSNVSNRTTAAAVAPLIGSLATPTNPAVAIDSSISRIISVYFIWII